MFGLLLLLAWIPIPYAGYLDGSRGLLEIGALALLLCWLLFAREATKGIARAWNQNQWILVGLLGWLSLQLLQTIPMPQWLLGGLNPKGLEAYLATGDIAPGAWLPISVDVGSTLKAFLNNVAYITIFLLTLVLVDSRRRLQWILVAIVMVVSAEAIWGMLLQSLQVKNSARAMGSFHNPNHFAGFMELGLGATIGLLLSRRLQRKKRRKSLRGEIVVWIDWLFSRRLLLYGVCLLLIAALMQSGSRAGFLSFGLASVLILTIMAISRIAGKGHDKTVKPGGFGKYLLLFGVLVFIAVSLGAGRHLADRMRDLSNQGDGRSYYRQGTAEMTADVWPMGFGAGTWEQVFGSYRPLASYEWRLWPHAHNEYLELLSEDGFVGFFLFGGVLVFSLTNILNNVFDPSSRFTRGLSLGISLGLISLLIHAGWDYQFHIPANTVYFFVLLALGLNARTIEKESSER